MLTVSLAGVKFKAPIGLYPQEALIQNDIVVNIAVSLPASIDDLPLIDYTILHRLVSEAIQEPTAFLETIVQRIVHKVQEHYPESKLSVAVRKLHPPMPGEVEYSEVKWESQEHTPH